MELNSLQHSFLALEERFRELEASRDMYEKKIVETHSQELAELQMQLNSQLNEIKELKQQLEIAKFSSHTANEMVGLLLLQLNQLEEAVGHQNLVNGQQSKLISQFGSLVDRSISLLISEA